MDREEFNELLKKANLNKKELADIVGLSYSAVNNWGSGSDFPRWVSSWLDNYIKAKEFENIKLKVFSLSSSWELGIAKIFKDIDPDYEEQAAYLYADTKSVDKTIKMINIATSINRDANALLKCNDEDINKLHTYLKDKNFKVTNEDEAIIINFMNGHKLTLKNY